MKLLFATNNRYKCDEVRAILGNSIEVVSLEEVNFRGELPETHTTLKENAAEKAQFIYERFNMNCFAEDTGLEVEALNGEPGVYSARYAGEGKSATDNIRLLLQRMNGISNRRAGFRTIICLIWQGRSYFFEGFISGFILTVSKGDSGFGYDPVFVPDGFEKTFAEMDQEEKNRLSHRGKAILAMKEFLFGEEEKR